MLITIFNFIKTLIPFVASYKERMDFKNLIKRRCNGLYCGSLLNTEYYKEYTKNGLTHKLFDGFDKPCCYGKSHCYYEEYTRLYNYTIKFPNISEKLKTIQKKGICEKNELNKCFSKWFDFILKIFL